jgi:hypothetical protein
MVLVRVPGVRGVLIGNHQYDVLVGYAVLAENLVHPERVHRMPVVEPVPAGGDDHPMDVGSLNIDFQLACSRKTRATGQETCSYCERKQKGKVPKEVAPGCPF